MNAYRIKANQLSGGPDWINTEFFDMSAEAERPSGIDELNTMLKNLLVEQFHLQTHTQTTNRPVYGLLVDVGGPKLTPAKTEFGDPSRSPIEVEQKRFLHDTWHAKSVSMNYFAFWLSQSMDRPIVNETKLPGSFDFDLSFTRDLPPNISPNAMLNGLPIDTSGPTIFEALRNQLGLKLERQNGPVDVLVIDHVEKPIKSDFSSAH